MMPADFVAEVAEASAAGDAAKLMLLRFEIEGLPWQSEAALLLAESEVEVAALDRVILFTGHRIDSADRATPRFPPSAEGSAWEAIREVVRGWTGALGISGGANGGDILFQEVCLEEGIGTEMLLAFPSEEFVPESVEADSGDWVGRFERLRQCTRTRVLAGSKRLPDWLGARRGYDIWQRNNLWLVAAAVARRPKRFVLVGLWDGAGGDGPGGTEHMVALAKEHGAEFVWLDVRRLFVAEGGDGVEFGGFAGGPDSEE